MYLEVVVSTDIISKPDIVLSFLVGGKQVTLLALDVIHIFNFLP